MLDLPVVLGVEDVVDGGQADILVAAAVAGDEVAVEQFVVVGRSCGRGSVATSFRPRLSVSALIDLSGNGPPGPSGSDSDHGHGVMRDVVEEGVARADRADRQIRSTGLTGSPRSTTMSSPVLGMPSGPMPTTTCGEAVAGRG